MNVTDRITILPDMCEGAPTIRGMRITVKKIVDALAAGESYEELMRAYPFINADDIRAAIEYAAHNEC